MEKADKKTKNSRSQQKTIERLADAVPVKKKSFRWGGPSE